MKNSSSTFPYIPPALPGPGTKERKQENRGRGSLVIRENLTKGPKGGENHCDGEVAERQGSKEWQASSEAGGRKQGRQRAELGRRGTTILEDKS